MKRIKRRGLARNACVALGNRGDPGALAPLARALAADPEPLVRGHAAWALGEIARKRPEAREAVDAALLRAAGDADASVREEVSLALQAITG